MRMFDMAKYLSTLKNDITVVCPFPSFPPGTFERKWKLAEKHRVDTINIVNLWTWQPIKENPGFFERILYYGVFSVYASIFSLVFSKEYDIIVTTSPPIFTYIPGFFSKKVWKKNWMIDVRDLWIDASISLEFLRKGSLFEKFSSKFEKLSLRTADLIAVTTNELGRRIIADPLVQGKIVHIPNGVDVRQFFPNLAGEKKNQFVYSGNIGHAQDLELVISAMKIVLKKYSINFLLVGSGDKVKTLVEYVKENNLDNSIIFAGSMNREQIPAILNQSIFGVAPLKNLETLEYAAPTKVYEYMACGIPFLGTGKGEILNIAHESGAGIMAENSAEDIAEKIIFFLENPDFVAEMGRKGREYTEKWYDRKEIAAHLNDHIERLYGR